MNNKIFDVKFLDNTTAIIEGKDLNSAFENHFGEHSQLMQEFYYSHTEITNNYVRATI